MTVAQAYRIFYQFCIRHLVVLDGRLEMVGIFTQTDLVRSLREKAFAGVCNVSQLMARRSVSCIVVVEIDRPVGIFTERDVVRHIAKGVDLNALPMASVMSP